jgi:hypothetical protein
MAKRKFTFSVTKARATLIIWWHEANFGNELPSRTPWKLNEQAELMRGWWNNIPLELRYYHTHYRSYLKNFRICTLSDILLESYRRHVNSIVLIIGQWAVRLQGWP